MNDLNIILTNSIIFFNLKFNHLSKTKTRNIIFAIKKIVEKSQSKYDLKRAEKLKKLKCKNEPNFETVKILNYSEIDIPTNIIKILQYGTERPVGGTPNSFQIMKEMEKLLIKGMDKICRGMWCIPYENIYIEG